MTQGGRLKMAALFAVLSCFYTYVAFTEKTTIGVFGQVWGAVGFAILATVFLIRALKTDK